MSTAEASPSFKLLILGAAFVATAALAGSLMYWLWSTRPVAGLLVAALFLFGGVWPKFDRHATLQVVSLGAIAGGLVVKLQ